MPRTPTLTLLAIPCAIAAAAHAREPALLDTTAPLLSAYTDFQPTTNADDATHAPTADPAATREQEEQRVALQDAKDQKIPPVFTEFKLLGGGQTKSKLDGGGSYTFTRGQARATVHAKLSDRWRANIGVGYEYDRYEFSLGGSLAGLNPWRDIQAARVRGGLSYAFDQQWIGFGGAFFTLAGEKDADFDQAFTVGGLGGLRYQVNQTDYVGVGLVVQQQIEDNLSIFPIVLFNVDFDQHWVLRNSSYDLGSSGGAGAEIAYRFDKEWALALGSIYDTRRFRLNDAGIAPDGVGDAKFIPIYLELNYAPSREAEFSIFAGAVVWSQLRLESSTGSVIAQQDAEPSAAFGGSITIRF